MYFMVPASLLLYRDCSALLMHYAPLGTLIDLLAILMHQQNRTFNAREHEFISASVALQVMSSTVIVCHHTQH
jgi:hypothetical protein